MARSTFYYHFRKSKQPDKYAREKESIIRLYHEHKGRYGYRRITVEMNKIGYAINHKTVLKLMNICGIKSQVRLRKYCSYKGQIGRIAPNLLQRDFAAEKPNQKWVTDLTEFSVCGVKLYLSPIMDLYNREIISYKIAERPNFMQIMKMLDDAFARIPDSPGIVLHSDQGWQYQMKQYQLRLRPPGQLPGGQGASCIGPGQIAGMPGNGRVKAGKRAALGHKRLAGAAFLAGTAKIDHCTGFFCLLQISLKP